MNTQLLPLYSSTLVSETEASEPEMPNTDEGLQWRRLSDSEEKANAITHGVACALAFLAAVAVVATIPMTVPTLIGFLVYAASLVAVLFLSTVSHVVTEPERLHRARAWDQGAIYCLIAGTYTPGVVAFSSGWTCAALLLAIWALAAVGFYSKVISNHLVHSIDTWTYILLGWGPAMVLAPKVPMAYFLWMLGGGVAYSLGVVFLMNDQKVRFYHAAWHVLVVIAAGIHFFGIYSLALQV